MSVKILGKEVGPHSFGMMGFTWRPTPTPQEQANATLRAALAKGANFWNGGEICTIPNPIVHEQAR